MNKNLVVTELIIKDQQFKYTPIIYHFNISNRKKLSPKIYELIFQRGKIF